ncbi:MAG: nucleotide-diphospho-sugar transferase [Paludibacteraceae bacterium]|jgi:hypothetical protein|nr:nucleotide-diphospho-sugar transferase [Paludibacteraceae bacterium]
MNGEVPVLYIIFNRLDTVKSSFEAIRTAQPKSLYIAADGPRKDREGESDKCEEVRSWVLSHIDWNCDVHTHFQKENLGCGHHPEKAISWLFENEECGVILEDDCVASPSFFDFASEMLKRYKDDDRISIVCGSNFDQEHRFQSPNADYFFSKISYTWGWATWRRSWKHYDFSMNDWNSINQRKLLKWLFSDLEYREYWRFIFDETYMNQPQDLWDYQFFFLCYKRRQMSVVPNVNVISNIGIGEYATHTIEADGKMCLETDNLFFPLKHPVDMVCNSLYDSHLQEVCYGRIPVVSRWKKMKRAIKKLLK